MKPLGKVQRDVLEALKRYGRWYRGCGWLWDTHSNTQRVLESLVKRGLVVKRMEGCKPVYEPVGGVNGDEWNDGKQAEFHKRKPFKIG